MLAYFLTVILASGATPGGVPAGNISTYKDGPYTTLVQCETSQKLVWQDKRVINATCKLEAR